MFDWVLDTPLPGNIEKHSRGYCSVIINSSVIIKSKEDFSEINIESHPIKTNDFVFMG